MSELKVCLKHRIEDEKLIFELPEEPYKSKLLELSELCNKKSNGFCTVTINRVYKPRTTGQGSQNNLAWKLITIIANEVGEDVTEIERQAKIKAISKGYPYHVSKITGEPIPESMKKIDTVQCSYLIDTLYELCSFLGIILSGDLIKEKNQIDNLFEKEKEEEFLGDIF